MARSDGYFLRAESLYNVATYIQDEAGQKYGYGTVPLHQQSHGELFLTLMTERFGGNGLYLFDEPEAALSPQRQLSFLVALHEKLKVEIPEADYARLVTLDDVIGYLSAKLAAR